MDEQIRQANQTSVHETFPSYKNILTYLVYTCIYILNRFKYSLL